MTRKSIVEREQRKLRTVQKYADKRALLLESLKDSTLTYDKRFKIRLELESLPRDSSIVRYTRRCSKTGRPKGVLTRRFKLCRHMVTLHGMRGDIPGLTKSSW